MSFAAAVRRILRPIALVAAVSVSCLASARAQSIRGRVVDERGSGVPRAEVQVLPSGNPVFTDASGAFDLGPLATGLDSIRVRRVGFEMTVVEVLVPLVGPRLSIVLRHSAALLDTVHTNALEQRLPRLFLRESQHLGAALYGPALDSMFARGGSRNLFDKLTIDGRFSRKLRNPQAGPLCIYVDGIRVRSFVENYITEKEISAIEVFDSDAFVHEPFTDGEEFRLVKGKLIRECGRLVLIWSKYYQQPHWAGH